LGTGRRAIKRKASVERFRLAVKARRSVSQQLAEQIITTVQTAEAAGFESAWTFEHAMTPVDNKSKYPYNESGELGVSADTPFFDSLITLAAHTTTIRLGTCVHSQAFSNVVHHFQRVCEVISTLSNEEKTSFDELMKSTGGTSLMSTKRTRGIKIENYTFMLE
jgi:hypothetical protein